MSLADYYARFCATKKENSRIVTSKSHTHVPSSFYVYLRYDVERYARCHLRS
jgi:hypothetical protein